MLMKQQLPKFSHLKNKQTNKTHKEVEEGEAEELWVLQAPEKEQDRKSDLNKL